MPEIPVPKGPEELELLPDSAVAELSKAAISEPPEPVPFSLSFASYMPDMCDIDGMDGSHSAAALKTLRDVGVHYFDDKSFAPPSSKVAVRHVANSGDYSVFYKSLGADQEVYELKYDHLKKDVHFRIFFFTMSRTFHVRAVRSNHLDMTKGKWK